MTPPQPAERAGGWPALALSADGAAAVAAAPAPAAVRRPATNARRLRAHQRAMPYHRLAAAVLLVNAIVAGLDVGDWRVADGSALSALSALALANLAAAVLIRQQHVLNVLFRLAGRAPRTWPLALRWSISKVHHVGGVHVGAALAGSAWLAAFTVVATVARVRDPAAVSLTTVVLADALAVLALVICAGAAPAVRARRHELFEWTHRFGGWTAVGLLWGLTVHLALARRPETSAPAALAGDWHVWVLALLTASIAAPWLRLRRVPVTVERPSAHAAIVTFDHGVTPAHTSAIGISRSPLREWHAFATVTTPGRSGFRILISRAGDWTGRFLDDPPSHVWVRGVPTVAPMAQAARLYDRVVYVVTGSGIGPVLGLILAAPVPARLVWSTRDPRATYGDALVDEVLAVQPDALIWDTTQRGKPDLAQLARQACRDAGGQAVFVVANKPATLRLVHELERGGIPAFGPIWDS